MFVKASGMAYTIGVVGTAFMAGATFSYLGGMIPLCIILAVPAFVGWVIPYFIYNRLHMQKVAEVTPLIEAKYDELYEIFEKASGLLAG